MILTKSWIKSFLGVTDKLWNFWIHHISLWLYVCLLFLKFLDFLLLGKCGHWPDRLLLIMQWDHNLKVPPIICSCRWLKLFLWRTNGLYVLLIHDDWLVLRGRWWCVISAIVQRLVCFTVSQVRAEIDNFIFLAFVFAGRRDNVRYVLSFLGTIYLFETLNFSFTRIARVNLIWSRLRWNLSHLLLIRICFIIIAWWCRALLSRPISIFDAHLLLLDLRLLVFWLL